MTASKCSTRRRGNLVRVTTATVLLPLFLGGCAGTFDRFSDGVSSSFDRVSTSFASIGGPKSDLGSPPAGPRADVNASTRLGDINIPVIDTPTLQQIIDRTPPKKKDDADETPQDKMRQPAMRDAALSYGARGGLAWTSRGINEDLRTRSRELTKTYDFNRILIKTPSQATIMPPVISEASETYETSDAGKTLRVADKVYEIVEQARFVPVAPLWHSYLVRSYTTPEPPPDSLLPKTDGERDAWKRWVTEGWAAGGTQAREIFQADLRRLERDFIGMLRYKALLEEGKVSAPIVSEGNLGVTGTGQDMRVNDRALRITRDPLLQTRDSGGKGFEATPSPTSPTPSAQDLPTTQVEPPADNSRARTGQGWQRY